MRFVCDGIWLVWGGGLSQACKPTQRRGREGKEREGKGREDKGRWNRLDSTRSRMWNESESIDIGLNELVECMCRMHVVYGQSDPTVSVVFLHLRLSTHLPTTKIANWFCLPKTIFRGFNHGSAETISSKFDWHWLQSQRNYQYDFVWTEISLLFFDSQCLNSWVVIEFLIVFVNEIPNSPTDHFLHALSWCFARASFAQLFLLGNFVATLDWVTRKLPVCFRQRSLLLDRNRFSLRKSMIFATSSLCFGTKIIS